jgi:hypothetical protein
MPSRCLSFHASYRCRHAGECCRAGWDVDVEPHIFEAVSTGRVAVHRTTPVAFTEAAEGASMAHARTASGDCGFHHDCRCSLQLTGGDSLLPSACRHFPRVYLRDARGDLLTLSHFCPTAASLLMEDGAVAVVDARAPLALDEPIEGLDARGVLPPLLRPGMLADMDGYDAWERAVIETFVDAPDAVSAFARIEGATSRVRGWTPGSAPMRVAVADAFARAEDLPGPPLLSAAFTLVAELTGPHPLMEVPPDFAARWLQILQSMDARRHRSIGRYLAASTFANWIAYRGQGLRSIVAWLQACYDVLRVQMTRALTAGSGALDERAHLEAIRMTDYIMVHTVDSVAFGREALRFER